MAPGEEVWTLQDLKILHQLNRPVTVVSWSMYNMSPHSSDGMHEVARVLFQNTECFTRYGPVRPLAANAEVLDSMPSTDKAAWKGWFKELCQGHSPPQPLADITSILRPCFQGVNETSHITAKLESKVIKLELAPGKVERATLHIIELPASAHETRVAAMQHLSPIHTFMFDSKGTLLVANASAVEAYQCGLTEEKRASKAKITLKSLFDIGLYPEGESEAEAAYEEAMNDIFNLQLECHRHQQPHTNHKGLLRWEMIEMWPMPDPVDGSPAVLVKRYNITQQKELELKLAEQQEALQRQNQELEQDTLDAEEEKLRLQLTADRLTQHLDAIMKDKFSFKSSAFDADTPIDKTLNFLSDYIGGAAPAIQAAMDLYHILSESDTHLRQPVGLEEQLLQNRRMSSDVGKSMLQLLQGSAAADVPDAPLVSLRSSSSSSEMTMPFIPADITPAVERLLQDAENNWHFDIFAFADATPGTTLSMLTFHLYKRAGLIRHFKLDEFKLCNFLQKIESGYKAANPYHNSIHAASVVQMTHMLLCHGGILASKSMSIVQHLSSYWSAAVHDYEHGGLNNDFLIKTAHPLALLYNDISPLENHHISAAAQLLMHPEYAYIEFKMLTGEVIKHARGVCVSQVLGTDMKKHFDILSRFQTAFHRPPASSSGAESAAPAITDWDAVKGDDKTLIYQMAIKCADIAHLSVDKATHKRWALQLEEEFFRQGDQEKLAGLPISPLMDRSTKGGMTRSQLGFFSIVGIPMFKALVELFPDAQPMLDGVLDNHREWENIAAAQAAGIVPQAT